MFKKHPQLRLKKADFRPDMTVLLRIFGMGAQMALQGALLSVGMMAITRVINGFGADVVAAFTVGSNVQNLAVMLFSNFSFGFSVYVGRISARGRPSASAAACGRSSCLSAAFPRSPARFR